MQEHKHDSSSALRHALHPAPLFSVVLSLFSCSLSSCPLVLCPPVLLLSYLLFSALLFFFLLSSISLLSVFLFSCSLSSGPLVLLPLFLQPSGSLSSCLLSSFPLSFMQSVLLSSCPLPPLRFPWRTEITSRQLLFQLVCDNLWVTTDGRHCKGHTNSTQYHTISNLRTLYFPP